MPDYPALLGASKSASTLLVLFIPSMSKNVEKIADLLGAKVVSQVPETGGGAFGAARLTRLVTALRARLESAD